MPIFGTRSKANLATAHPDLVRVATEAIKVIDFTVLESHRGKDRQEALFRDGLTQVHYPHSKHNSMPSQALDTAPWPIDWLDTERFVLVAGVWIACAHRLGIGLRWGGDWDSDFNLREERFRDYGHFELY